MKIQNVSDEEFLKYGKIIDIDTCSIVTYLKEKATMPKEKNLYVRDDLKMHDLNGISSIKQDVFGLGDIEVGYCNGYNSLLNCLEYHSCPEVDIAGDDLVLLLARVEDVKDGKIKTEDIKAFLLKEGQAVILYPYTMHFSPCKLKDSGFRSAIILSDKTNMDLIKKPLDNKLWKVNKWLFAHKDSIQASLGAYIGIEGENIKVDY